MARSPWLAQGGTDFDDGSAGASPGQFKMLLDAPMEAEVLDLKAARVGNWYSILHDLRTGMAA